MDQELTAELVVDGLVPSAPVLSPDGRWVAYLLSAVGHVHEHPSDQLWVAAVDGSAAPRRLDTATARLSSARWSADSGSLSFLSDRAGHGTAQLHRIGCTGRSARALTRWPAGVQAHRPLVDPALVAFAAADGDGGPARLRLLDLRTGRIRTPARFADRHVVDVVQRPDGGPLAVLTWSSPELDPGLIQRENHSPRERDHQLDLLRRTRVWFDRWLA